MNKVELALSNFAQRISTARMVLSIGDKLAFGETPYELMLKLRQVTQLHKLFDYEYGKAEESNLELLQKTVLVINTLINNYRLEGTYVLSEYEIVPIPNKQVNFIILTSYTPPVSDEQEIQPMMERFSNFVIQDAEIPSGGFGTLQQVTDLGNETSNLIKVTGQGNVTFTDGLGIYYSGTDFGQAGFISNFASGRITGTLSFSPSTVSLGLDLVDGSGGGVQFQAETEEQAGVSLSKRVSAHEAVNDNELITLGQARELSGGSSFEVITAVGNLVNITSSGMKKVMAYEDLQFSALDMPFGSEGIIIVKQDDLGGHLYTLVTGNSGTLVLNSLPRATSEIRWTRTDEGVYFTAFTLNPGIEATTIPTIAIDDYYDTLEVYHQLPDSEIEMSIDNGDWVAYPGPFSIGAVNRPVGYWRFRIRAAENRIVSGIAYSNETHAEQTGFDYILPAPLS